MKLITLLKKSFHVFEREDENDDGEKVNTFEVYEEEDDCEPIGIFYELEDGNFRWGNIFGKIPHNTVMTEGEFKNIVKNGNFL